MSSSFLARFFRAAYCLALGLPLAAHAQFLFSTNNGALMITNYSGNSPTLVIPAMTNGLPITGLGTYALLSGSFSSVVIPNSITTIGDGAFYACLGITQLNIPASVTNISTSAFNFTYNLTNFTVDAANPAYTSINGVMFDKAQQGIFQYPENSPATNYVIPNTVTSVGATAFYANRNLRNISIPNGVTNIGLGAFLGCTYLSQIAVPDSVITIGDTAFTACQFMTNITLGTNLQTIGIDAFDNCSSLAYPLVIPDSVTSVGHDAFVDCSSLPSITLGAGLTNLGTNTFQYCAALMAINVNVSNTAYSSSGGVLFDKAQSTLLQYPVGLTAPNYVVPATVKSIADHAFDGGSKVFGLTLDAALTNIGNYAFNGCYNMGDVTIPNNVITIGGEAFDGCYTTHNVSLGNHVTSIGPGAFYACLGLFGVNIPAGVTNIGLQAFDDCGSMTSITVDSANPSYSSSGGVLFNKTMTQLIQFPNGIYGIYAVPTNVTDIAADAFDTSVLTSLTMTDSVTNIGTGAFYRDNFTNLVLSTNLISIGANAFAFTKLTNIVIPNSVVYIGDDAFQNCASLTNITIGSGLITLGRSAFYNCKALLAAYFQGNAPANDGSGFNSDTKATVYYQPGTSGWGSTYGGIPAKVNPNAPAPLKLLAGGFISNQFTLKLIGPAQSTVVMQAATNLHNPVWVPVGTNTLSTNGTGTFQDVQSTNLPRRFYRLSPQ